MKNLFTSLNGALTLSFAALLIEIFHGFVDSMFVYSKEFAGGELTIAVAYAVFIGIWVKGLLVASGGSRPGIIAAFAVGLLFWIGQDLMTLLVFCPGGCNSPWSSIAAWAGVAVGGLALIALGLQLGRKAVRLTA